MKNEMIQQPPSQVPEKALSVSDEFVPQVRTYGALGYTKERVLLLLNIPMEDKRALSIRMSVPGDVYYEAYMSGKAIGEYNVDVELAKKAEAGDVDATRLLEERKLLRQEYDLRKKLFGV